MTKYRVGSRLVFEVVGDPGPVVECGNPRWATWRIGDLIGCDGVRFRLVEKPEPIRPVDASDAKRLADNVAMIDVSGHVKGCGCRICEVVAMAKEILSRLEGDK